MDDNDLRGGAIDGPARALGLPAQLAIAILLLATVTAVAFGAAWIRYTKSHPSHDRPPVAIVTTPSATVASTPTSLAPTQTPAVASTATPPLAGSAPRAQVIKPVPAATRAAASKPPAATSAPTPAAPSAPVPDAAAGSAVGYDAAGGYPVLANQQVTGGQGFTTWKWDGVRWVQIQTAAASSPYASSNMVVDPQAGMTVVMSGGALRGWNGTRWVTLGTLPEPVLGQAYLAFDQARGQLLLLDSSNAGAVTWSYAAGAWKKVNTAAAPRSDFGGGLAYDPRNGTTVLYGGGDMGGPHGGTWTWNGSVWTLQHPVNAPPPGSAALAYDGATRQMILLAQNGTTWEWDGAGWSHLGGASPSYGGYAGLVFDSARQQLFLWEGAGGYEQGSQTWTYAGGVWTRRF